MVAYAASPTPTNERAIINWPKFRIRPVAAVATLHALTPSVISRVRDNRSPSLPKIGDVMKYATRKAGANRPA